MEDMENHEKTECGKKIKQQITVPFLWEEKPGQPIKDWQPKREPLDPVPLPVKYITSIPFKWEEKPGTPLRCFARESTIRNTQEKGPEDRSLPLPPAYFTKYENESDEGESSYGDGFDDLDWLSELDFDAISIQSGESFCSAPWLTPLQNPYIEEQNEDGSGPIDYAARNTSLKGAAFLAHLFPMYTPKSAFLEPKISPQEKRIPPTIMAEHTKLAGDGRRSGVIRRPCTLGELIMQSRRRSYRRKAANMKKIYQQKEQDFKKNRPQGCFNIVASGGGLTNILRKEFLALNLS